MRKKGLILLTVCALCASFIFGCNKTTDTPAGSDKEAAEVANPVNEVTKDEMVEATGIDLDAPEGAEDVVYSTIQMNEEELLAQVNFTMDGKAFYYRALYTSLTDISDDTSIDISGLEYDFPAGSGTDVNYCPAKTFVTDEASFIAWVDVVPGILYNLGSTDGASAEDLENIANLTFVPAQGEN